MEITLSGGEMMLACLAGNMRQVTAIRDRRKDFYPGDGDGAEKWGAHIIGCFGEMVVAKHFGIYWNGTIGAVHLGDVGPFEVRTRIPGKYGADLALRPTDDLSKKYILVVANPPVFNIAGWIKAADGVTDEYKHPNSIRGADLYYVPQEDLRPINEIGRQ